VNTVLSLTLLPRPVTTRIANVDAADLDDGTLIERAAAHERFAFEELYRRFARTVYGLALRRIGDRGLAEDTVQEVFAAVWRSAASYDRARGSGGAWIYVIARNATVDAQRRRHAPTVANPPETVSTAATPDEEAEASWNAWCVHRALETLPEHERSVIDLAYFSGLSQTEIADLLQVPLGTVKTRTRAGLARLADALEGEL
jgi:RNA polymerase sigma-70 factor, ECF subfamily